MLDFCEFLAHFFGFGQINATRIVPHVCIAHVSCFQSRLRSLLLSMLQETPLPKSWVRP